MQESVDALFETTAAAAASITGPNKRRLIAVDMLKRAKHGRFRQNLLAKRRRLLGAFGHRDRGGTETINPQCGLPKKRWPRAELKAVHLTRGSRAKGPQLDGEAGQESWYEKERPEVLGQS